MKYRELFTGLFLVSAILLLALGCAEDVIALTDIAANPQPYIGRTVTTEGYVNLIGTRSMAEIVELTDENGKYSLILAEPLPSQAQSLSENDYIRVKGTLGSHNLGEALTCIYLAPQSITKVTARSTVKGLSTALRSRYDNEAIAKLNVEELSYLAIRDSLEALQELGRRYAAGDGVGKNEIMASECFARADALKRLDGGERSQDAESIPEALILTERQRLTEANALDNAQQISLKDLYHQAKRLQGKPVTVEGEVCNCLDGSFYISNRRECIIINAIPQSYQLSIDDIVEVTGFVSGIFIGDPIIEPVSIKVINHRPTNSDRQHNGSESGQPHR